MKISMRWPYLRWLAVVVVVLVLQGHGTMAAPNPSNDDMMRELLKLDQMYSSIARPSLRSGPVQTEIRPRVVQRAIIRLQELDRLYADRARPRFGKRTPQTDNNLTPFDYDNTYQSDQDIGEWLPARR
ncbi:uncharacterized protein isoform X1 [Leptinotarsa decemlineata]|uniref:uncharacterized protein isoform X1 n=1 Tax=Leptinotarsa decemlineata TaxID=7539 RepID=UPI003D30A464